MIWLGLCVLVIVRIHEYEQNFHITNGKMTHHWHKSINLCNLKLTADTSSELSKYQLSVSTSEKFDYYYYLIRSKR